MEEDKSIKTARSLASMVDFKLPLVYVISGTVVIGWTIVSMYFTMNQLARDMNEVQATLKAGNAQSAAIAGDIALLRYRVDNIEASIKARENFR